MDSDRKNDSFDMLETKLSVNLSNMVDLNYLPKLIELKKYLTN